MKQPIIKDFFMFWFNILRALVYVPILVVVLGAFCFWGTFMWFFEPLDKLLFGSNK